jgi:hypothetical protein
MEDLEEMEEPLMDCGRGLGAVGGGGRKEVCTPTTKGRGAASTPGDQKKKEKKVNKT